MKQTSCKAKVYIMEKYNANLRGIESIEVPWNYSRLLDWYDYAVM